MALPVLGLHPFPTMFLRLLHLVCADLLLVVAGLHLGLNWKWVVAAIRKQFVAPAMARAGRRTLSFLAIGTHRATPPE